MSRLGHARVLALVVLIVAAWMPSAWQGMADEPARIELVVVETTTGAHSFQTEIADTPHLRERGLMFRHRLADDRAMLFDWGQVRVATMWMRNTYIPLDMVFISSSGRVESIAENTEPHSLKIISSQIPVAAVLEVTAGTAKRIGLKPGDKVVHKMFKAE